MIGKRCQFCRHALLATDYQGDSYVQCRLIPPRPVAIVEGGKMAIRWLRPEMPLAGYCGQFRLSVLKFLFRGKRT
jgi:hypothetical protein